MYTVKLYQRIRRACHVEGMSVREDEQASMVAGSKSILNGPSRHSASGAGVGRPVSADYLRGESEMLD
jgi:hypothetical protein